MDLRLHGRHAFVSGSTQGIGFAIAEALLAEGAAVTVNGRTPARVQAAADRLRAEHPESRVGGIAADFADAAAVADLTARLTVPDAPPVDLLVNNVGRFDVGAFTDADDDEWQRYLDVNLMSGVRLSRALLPGMLERGTGRIVFVASESGVNVPADMIPYGAAKAATLALANGLAKLTRGTAVTVNSVLGGPTYSDGVAAVVDSIAIAQGVPAEAVRDAIIGENRTTLLERFLDPAEIAALVAFLCSPLASATNGAAVRADGGVLTGVL